MHWWNLILNLTIIAGPELPIGINGHSMVPFGSGQAIIGGYGDGAYQGKIYHLTCSQRICNIQPMTQELSVPRQDFVAIPIPDHLSGCTEGKISHLFYMRKCTVITWSTYCLFKENIACFKNDVLFHCQTHTKVLEKEIFL